MAFALFSLNENFNISLYTYIANLTSSLKRPFQCCISIILEKNSFIVKGNNDCLDSHAICDIHLFSN